MKLSDNFGQEIDFELSPKYKKIGINCSGGADSSILVFMTAKYLHDIQSDAKISVLSCANDLKHRWNARKAADVINYTIDSLCRNYFDMHYTYYRDRQDIKYFHDVESRLFDENRIDMIIGGITANPKIEATVENRRGQLVNLSDDALPDRNTHDAAAFWEGHRGAYYMPLINVDKRFVAAMYSHYGVDDLIDLTRSCEAIPDNKVYDPSFENNPCGMCWWCLERKWAFGRL